MRCTLCRRESPADARFCTGCDAPLVLVCPACEISNTGDSRYCKACGGRFPVRRRARPPAPARHSGGAGGGSVRPRPAPTRHGTSPSGS